jgi:riboflavin-specific deaminase-like protein
MLRLIPDPGETTVEHQLSTLDLAALAPENRPYLVTNFAVTLDGRATIGGRSGPIGSSTDTDMLMGLRSVVEAVMIGAGTMRVERYGRVVPSGDRRSRREEAGLRHDPLMVLVSGSLELPWDAELFTAGAGEVVVFTSSEKKAPETATPLEVVRHSGRVDLAAALEHLRRDRGIRSVLSEGGPHLHGQLVAEGLVDELFVTVAPKLAGGEGPGLVGGLPEDPRDLELLWLLDDDGELFARYGFRSG